MKKRGDSVIVNGLIVLVVTAAILHTSAHFAVYGTGVSGYGESGVSGYAIGGKAIDQIKQEYSRASIVSKIIIIGEWSLLVLLIGISLVGDKIRTKKTRETLEINRSKDKSNTDIDLLYEALKERKSIPISTISETFKISDQASLEWAKILEDAGLATIYYPRFGEAELKLKE